MDIDNVKLPPVPPIRPDKSLAAFFGLIRKWFRFSGVQVSATGLSDPE